MNVHKLRMDTSGNVEDISFVLAKKNGDKLGNITNVDNIVTKHSMKEASEFTFTAHKKMGDNIIKFWNDIKDFKLIWIPEWDMWYEITVEVNEKDENIKNVSGKTLGEAELSQIMLYGIEINTETDIAREDYKIPTTFYNPDHPEASLMDRLLTDKAPHYKVKHIDKSLMNLQRTFTFDDTSIYDALQEVSEELDCLFIFGCGSDENGKPERTISVYDLEANCVDCGNRDTFVHKCPKCGSTNIILGYGEYTNVFISRDNLADEITYSVDTDSVKNCMKLEAGDDLMTAAIRSCNPNGTDYIYYFPDETREEMSSELQEKLKSYDALYEKYQSDYNFTINDSFVTNYNALVNKYKTYEESLKDTEIKNPIVGYPKLMRIYFDTIDMVQLLRNKLMPPVDKPDNNAKSQGEYLMANLPSSASTTSLKNLSVSTADNIMVMLAQSIVKGVFKVTVTNTTLSNNVWKGKFNLENYADKDDKFTSQFVSISINENYESYVKQRIDSILARSDENYYDIVGLFKQDMTVFKSQLKKYCLNTLQIFQKCCQSCIDMMVQQGISSNSTSSIYGINTKVLYENVYIPYYNKMNAIQDEIKVRENELYTVEGKYNNQNQLVQDGVQIEIERIITEVQDALNFKNYIGIDLYKEFSSFIRMDKFSNDNYISDGLNNTDLMKNAIEFITVATKELFKSATLQHSITGTIKNFLRMKEFEPVTNNFKNGNWICVGIDDKVYQLRIVEYEIDFSDTQNISVTFSDVISTPDGMTDLESILANSSKMATSYSGVVRQSTINTNFKNKMNEMIAKGLSMTNTKIVSNADNQDITWDEHGLLCREYDDIISDYTDSQLKIINHGIYITDDNWKTARAGIGNFIYYDPQDKTYKESYGVIADTLVSNLILTSEVGIYNEEKSIEMAKDGIIVTTNTMNKNVFTIRKEITDDEGNITYERQLYIDDNGNIRLAGNASIAWDSITGTENVVVKDTLDTLMGTLQKEFSDKIVDLEKQNDKKAETWYQGTDPSVDWKTTADKKGHQGDLWYDTQNQKTYIYGVNGWEETKTNPPDDVFDKIDGKAQIFIVQPIPPYNVGDLWFNNETSDIMTCVKARATGNFDSTEWEKRNKYTDDSNLSTFLNNTYKTDIGNIQNQIDGKIETYRQSEDPSLSWTDADKTKHIGDLWYNTSTNETFMYTGSKWDAVSGNIPDEVWNTIDKKAQIFTDTPKPPYNKGDLWFVGEKGIYIDAEHPNEYRNEILTCINPKADGTSFSIDDWQKKNSYTDNSALNEFKNNVGYTQINSEWVISPNIKGGHLMITQNGSQYSAEITPDGKLKATGAEITGAITATSGIFTNVDIQSGKIGGFTLADNILSSSFATISPSSLSYGSNFSVDSSGKLSANGATITGDINATSIYAKDSYKIYASGLGKSIKAIWCGDNWKPNDGYVDLYIGNDSKSWAAFIDKTSSDSKFSRRAIVASQYFNTGNRQNNYSSVNCVTDQDTTYVELTTISKDTPASVRLQIAADSGLCFIPGDVNDSALTYDESIKLGTKSHKWMQVWTKNLYANGDTVRFSGISAKSSTRYLVIDSSGNVGYRDGNGGGGELVQEYTAGVGIKIVNNKISLTGTSKDNYRYVRNPIDGTLHMSNGCGWDLVNTDNKEVTGIYCNGSNEVIISEKDYDTILRGSSIQLGNSNTIVKIPYLPNYTSASKYLVDDGKGNIGWKTISSSGDSLTGGLTIKLNGTSQISSWKGASDASVNITASSIGAATTSWVERAFGSRIDVSNGYLYLYNNNGSQLSSVQLPTSSGGGNYAPLYHTHDSITNGTNTLSISNAIYATGVSLGQESTRLKNAYFTGEIKCNSIYYNKLQAGSGSDINLKHNIHTFDKRIEEAYMDFESVSFNYNYYKAYDDEVDNNTYYGFIAQQIETSLNKHNISSETSGLVGYFQYDTPNAKGLTKEYYLSYLQFISLNTHMTQKAHHRIDSLTQENQKLKNTIFSLQGEIAIIKQKLEELT